MYVYFIYLVLEHMFSPNSEMPHVTTIETEYKILASGVVIYLGGDMGK
jgi:hypothetical protein